MYESALTVFPWGFVNSQNCNVSMKRMLNFRMILMFF